MTFILALIALLAIGTYFANQFQLVDLDFIEDNLRTDSLATLLMVASAILSIVFSPLGILVTIASFGFMYMTKDGSFQDTSVEDDTQEKGN